MVLTAWATLLERARAAGVRRRASGRRKGSLEQALADPARYADAIDRLHEHHAFTSAMHELREGEVSLASVVAHRGEVARLLARAVAAGEYRPRPATLRSIRVEGRRRTVFASPLADQIVQGAVARILEEAAAPGLSPTLYSYRPGVPWWKGAAGFARFVRQHRAALPDPRSRGLYVIRRDVDAYTDSIPVTPEAPLWTMIDGLLGASFTGPVRAPDRELIQRVIRPDVAAPGGIPRRADRGVPTGQPISCVIFNVYLRDLDAKLAAVPGAFYARYSDDMLFAHPDPVVAKAAAARIAATLSDLGLAIQPSKSKERYLTGAGRASAAWPEAGGATGVTFLGFDVTASGTLALDRAKRRALLRDLARRAATVARLRPTGDVESLGRLVCGVLQEALDPDAAPTRQAGAVLLARAVTDRAQLRELDLAIARIAAAAITGGSGSRAFRAVSYRQLRTWGLPSLVHARNRAR